MFKDSIRVQLGGTTCLTLLVSYSIVCCLCVVRSVEELHNLPHPSPLLKKTCVRQVVVVVVVVVAVVVVVVAVVVAVAVVVVVAI